MNPPEVISRYQILQAIGQGGMGSIYLARDPKIGNRHVVIKLLREGFDNAELRERFSREADAAGGLHHVNIVTIFDVGDFDGQPFIAMEYIQGETLTDLIQRRAPLPLGRKLQLIEELCSGLRYAHRAGIIHRDIKPANIMVDQDGVLKILDFGIARLGGSGMTRAGMVMGTLNYMAPEQMAGQPVDARADIFSAGAVFYELLSYQRAFPGDLPGIVHKIMTATREPLAKLVPDLDPAIVAIVDRCLARDASDRYPDMGVVRSDVAKIRQRILYDEQRSLDTHMQAAQTALQRADFLAALEACEQALALDSEYQPAIELQQQARAMLDGQQVRDWLKEAHAEIERGGMTAASLLLDKALSVTVNSSSPDIATVREAIEDAKARIVDRRARVAQITAAIDKAQQQLSDGQLEEALASVDEVLRIEPSQSEAVALKARIASALENRRREQREAAARVELERRAEQTVEQARIMFAAHNRDKALALLEQFQPPHVLVAGALQELRQEARDIAQREETERQRELERQREAERQKEEERRRADVARQREAATIAVPVAAPPPPASAPAPRPTSQPAAPRPGPATPPAPQPLVGPTIRIERPIEASPIPPRSVPKFAYAAGAAVLVLAIIAGAFIWRATTSAAPTAVVFDVAPWATIDAITRKADGQRVAESGLVTPAVVSLPPGDYHVRASNPNFSILEFDVTVQSGDSQTVRREMPGFDYEREVTAVVGK